MNNDLISIISLLGINTPSAGFHFTSFTLNTKYNKEFSSFTFSDSQLSIPLPDTAHPYHNTLFTLSYIASLNFHRSPLPPSTCVKPSSFTEHAPIAKYNTASRRPRDFFPTATAVRPTAEALATKASLWLWNLTPRIV